MQPFELFTIDKGLYELDFNPETFSSIAKQNDALGIFTFEKK